MVLKLPVEMTDTFCYVDCGARGDVSKPLLSLFDEARYIGFDPELTVDAKHDSSATYFPVALGKKAESLEFHRTENLNCSSAFLPNREFLDRFIHVGNFFNIRETVRLNVVALDQYLPQNGITQADFIELDTQGSELDILQGAQGFLSSSILGVRVEVEFSAMYHNQPLFADVDSLLRQFGFMLFDLERYHLRRKSLPIQSSSREQIVWGQALYFKDWKNLAPNLSKQQMIKLAVISSYYGFESYAFEIIEHLLSNDIRLLTSAEKEQLANICYADRLPRKLSFRKRLTKFLRQMYGRIQPVLNLPTLEPSFSPEKNYFWKD